MHREGEHPGDDEVDAGRARPAAAQTSTAATANDAAARTGMTSVSSSALAAAQREAELHRRLRARASRRRRGRGGAERSARPGRRGPTRAGRHQTVVTRHRPVSSRKTSSRRALLDAQVLDGDAARRAPAGHGATAAGPDVAVDERTRPASARATTASTGRAARSARRSSPGGARKRSVPVGAAAGELDGRPGRDDPARGRR